MTAHILYWYHRIRTSFLFIPAVLVILFVAFAFGAIAVDASGRSTGLVEAGWLLSMTPDGARQLVSTIAGATITVTSLVFSLTLVTLTLASSQLGPRLIGSFMSDRLIQLALGLFVGVFVFALLVLAAISSQVGQTLVPSLSISLSVLLAIVCFLALIVFIHHVARFIQADNVVARIGRDLIRAIDASAHASFGNELVDDVRAAGAPAFAEDAVLLTAPDSGYVQAIDYDHAASCAEQNDVVIVIDVRPGQFLIGGQIIGRVGPGAKSGDDIVAGILKAIVLGQERTMAQDLEFAFRAIVEVAVRALSPGVNDPNTAIACINQLGGALAVVLEDEAVPNCRADGDGRPRLIFDRLTVDGLIDTSFDEIRQACAGHASVIIRLLEILTTLTGLARSNPQRKAIARHVAMVTRAAKAKLDEPDDRRDFVERLVAWRTLMYAQGTPVSEV
jgi:uncharacterized membrane protein